MLNNKLREEGRRWQWSGMRSLFSVLWDVCLDGDDSTLYTCLVSRHGDTGHRGQQCCSAAVLQRWSRGDSCQNVHLQMIMKVVQLAVSCSAAGPGNSAQYSHCSIYTIYMSVSTISILSVLYLHWSTYRIYTTCTISTIFAAQYLYCTLHSIYTAVSTVSTGWVKKK